MRRKLFCLALSATLFAFSVSAKAQQPGKIPRIGLLESGSPPNSRLEAFREGLRQLGYVEGKNIVIEYRWAGGETRSAPRAGRRVCPSQGRCHRDIIDAGDPGGPARNEDNSDRHGECWRSNCSGLRGQPRPAGWKHHRVHEPFPRFKHESALWISRRRADFRQ